MRNLQPPEPSPLQEKLQDGTLEDLSDKEITEGIMHALEERYAPSDGWHIFTEVGQGGTGNRRLDALALSAWRSRGYETHGIEVKASRGDWLSEVKDPAKQKWWMDRVDRFYLVAPTHVCNRDELPKGWGLLRYQNDGSLRKVHESNLPGSPTKDGAFIGILARRVQRAFERTPAAQELEQAKEEGYEKGYKRGKQDAGGRRYERMKEDRDHLEAAFKRFEEAVGVNIIRWMGEIDEDVLEAVKIIHEARRDINRITRAATALADKHERMAKDIRENIKDLPGVGEDVDSLEMFGILGGT